jgi:hypothetical protein
LGVVSFLFFEKNELSRRDSSGYSAPQKIENPGIEIGMKKGPKKEMISI